mmetsp:Transcript_26516/g.84977  ORF Transcript_26516/g.84977 Transcript_26516/m.84977 type:complete len:1904 (-) Transcript_26516:25-5736(-)
MLAAVETRPCRRPALQSRRGPGFRMWSSGSAALTALALLAAFAPGSIVRAGAQMVPVPSWIDAGMVVECHIAFTERLGECTEDSDGQVVHDHSGNGHFAMINDGKLFAGWGFPPMPSVYFDGSTDRNNVHLRRLPNRARASTISFWVYITQDMDVYSFINLYHENSGALNHLYITTGVKGSRNVIVKLVGGATKTMESGPVLRHRVWTHIVVMREFRVYGVDGVKLFVDGVFRAQKSGITTGQTKVRELYLGSDPALDDTSQGDYGRFTGFFADFKLFSPGTTAAAIKEMYDAKNPMELLSRHMPTGSSPGGADGTYGASKLTDDDVSAAGHAQSSATAQSGEFMYIDLGAPRVVSGFTYVQRRIDTGREEAHDRSIGLNVRVTDAAPVTGNEGSLCYAKLGYVDNADIANFACQGGPVIGRYVVINKNGYDSSVTDEDFNIAELEVWGYSIASLAGLPALGPERAASPSVGGALKLMLDFSVHGADYSSMSSRSTSGMYQVRDVGGDAGAAPGVLLPPLQHSGATARSAFHRDCSGAYGAASISPHGFLEFSNPANRLATDGAAARLTATRDITFDPTAGVTVALWVLTPEARAGQRLIRLASSGASTYFALDQGLAGGETQLRGVFSTSNGAAVTEWVYEGNVDVGVWMHLVWVVPPHRSGYTRAQPVLYRNGEVAPLLGLIDFQRLFLNNWLRTTSLGDLDASHTYYTATSGLYEKDMVRMYGPGELRWTFPLNVVNPSNGYDTKITHSSTLVIEFDMYIETECDRHIVGLSEANKGGPAYNTAPNAIFVHKGASGTYSTGNQFVGASSGSSYNIPGTGAWYHFHVNYGTDFGSDGSKVYKNFFVTTQCLSQTTVHSTLLRNLQVYDAGHAVTSRFWSPISNFDAFTIAEAQLCSSGATNQAACTLRYKEARVYAGVLSRADAQSLFAMYGGAKSPVLHIPFNDTRYAHDVAGRGRSGQHCPQAFQGSGWNLHNGACYKAVSTAATFAAAKSHCASLHSTLASCHTKADCDYVNTLASGDLWMSVDQTSASGPEADDSTGGVSQLTVFDDGSRVTYRRFDDSVGSSHDCFTLGDGTFTGNAQTVFKNWDCTANLNYVCKVGGKKSLDISGNGNHLTHHNSPIQWHATALGGRVSDYLELPNQDQTLVANQRRFIDNLNFLRLDRALRLGSERSFSMWIYFGVHGAEATSFDGQAGDNLDTTPIFSFSTGPEPGNTQKANQADSWYFGLIDKGGSIKNFRLIMYRGSTEMKLAFTANAGQHNIKLRTWVHMAFTVGTQVDSDSDGDGQFKACFYVDGSLLECRLFDYDVKALKPPSDAVYSHIYIGHSDLYDNPGKLAANSQQQPWGDFAIEDLRIYSHRLRASEVATIYSDRKAPVRTYTSGQLGAAVTASTVTGGSLAHGTGADANGIVWSQPLQGSWTRGDSAQCYQVNGAATGYLNRAWFAKLSSGPLTVFAVGILLNTNNDADALKVSGNSIRVGTAEPTTSDAGFATNAVCAYMSSTHTRARYYNYKCMNPVTTTGPTYVSIHQKQSNWDVDLGLCEVTVDTDVDLTATSVTRPPPPPPGPLAPPALTPGEAAFGGGHIAAPHLWYRFTEPAGSRVVKNYGSGGSALDARVSGDRMFDFAQPGAFGAVDRALRARPPVYGGTGEPDSKVNGGWIRNSADTWSEIYDSAPGAVLIPVDNTLMKPGAGFTVSFWMNTHGPSFTPETTGPNIQTQYPFGCGSKAFAVEVEHGFNDAASVVPKLFLHVGTNPGFTIGSGDGSSYNIQYDHWYHIAVMYSTSTNEWGLFVDGARVIWREATSFFGFGSTSTVSCKLFDKFTWSAKSRFLPPIYCKLFDKFFWSAKSPFLPPISSTRNLVISLVHPHPSQLWMASLSTISHGSKQRLPHPPQVCRAHFQMN